MMKYVVPFNEWREPAPDAKYVKLYRGDRNPVKNWSLAKSHWLNTFFDGIYFTDKKSVASEYGPPVVVNIPKEWVDQCLDTRKPVTPEILVILNKMIDMAAKVNAAPPERTQKLKDALKSWVDASISIEEVFARGPQYWYGLNDTEADYKTSGPIRKEASKLLRDELKKLGYKGIKYDGQVQGVGEVKNLCYVFWDEQGIKKLRDRTKQPGVSKA